MRTLQLGSLQSIILSGTFAFTGCYFRNNKNPESYPEPFRTALAEYQRKPDNEDSCSCDVDTFVRRTLRTDENKNSQMIEESEIDCERSYIYPSIGRARLVVASRDIFPDGRVNVTWDPGNKYKVPIREVQR